MKDINKFDYIVSLGYNCEVSFRIEEYLGHGIDSYPLSWAYVSDQQKMSFILENLDKTYSSELELTDWGMFHCKDVPITLHTTVAHQDLQSMTAQQRQQFDEQAQAEIRSRFRHMCGKWHQLLNSGDSTLFLLKQQPWNKDLNCFVETERWLHQNYKGGRYLLAVAVEDRALGKQIADLLPGNCAVLCVSRFADDSDTQNGGDRAGWLRGIQYLDQCQFNQPDAGINQDKCMLFSAENGTLQLL